jgi:hypothetical protein
MYSYKKLIDFQYTNYGEKEGIKRLKLYQLWIRNETLGLPRIELPFHKLDKIGFPKVFRPWRNLITDTDPNSKRYLNTIFGTVKGLTLPVSKNTETITSPSEIYDTSVIKDFCKYLESWNGVRSTKLELQANFLLRSTKGPNGPAVITSLDDINALQGEKELIGNVRELIKLTCIPEIVAYFDKKSEGQEPKGICSRLRFIPDKAGKTRVVAIADYWSQLCLYPVHKEFITQLRGMSSDCTYRQGHLATILKQKTGSGEYVGTADISAFTDRFPREPQKVLIHRVFGPRVAEAWIKVIHERKFTVDSSDSVISYRVGTPIGLYSSWAVATMSLHALVEYSALRVGKTNFRAYLILGDDVAIFNSSVYREFQHCIHLLGVKVSIEKSTESKHSAEIAKRLFSEGQEVSGYPVMLLTAVKQRPAQVLEALRLILDLSYSPVPLSRVLKLMGITYKSNSSALLSIPRALGGYPDAIHSAEDPLLWTLLETWMWPPERLQRVREICTQDDFWKEIQNLGKIVTNLEKASKIVNLRAKTPNRRLVEDHPLVFCLSSQLESYLATIGALQDDSTLDELFERSGRVYSLMFPPVSHPYTHRYIGQRRSEKISHIGLEVLSRLRSNDVSPKYSDQGFDSLFTSAFESAVVYPGS